MNIFFSHKFLGVHQIEPKCSAMNDSGSSVEADMWFHKKSAGILNLVISQSVQQFRLTQS